MARIERTSAQGKVTVKQAQLIDPSAFRFTGAGEGLKAIGGVLSELGQRKRDFQDRIGISNANAAMENAQREAEKELVNTPLEKKAEVRQKWTTQAQSEISQINLSAKAKDLAQNKAKIWSDTILDLGEIDDVELMAKEALLFTSDDYGKDLVEGSPEDIIESEIALDDVLSKQMTETEAKIFKEKIEATAVEQMQKNAIQIQKDKAVLAPQKTSDEVTAELDARKKGKKPSGEFALISNEDLESIRDYSKGIGEKQKAQSEINREAATVDAYSKIRDGAVDIDAIIDRNNLDPTQSDEDKITFAEKIPTYFNKINSTKSADESDNDVYDQLVEASERVERGDLSPAAFEELYADGKEKLNVSDQRAIREKDIVATRTMQNRTFSDAMITERPTFISATEDIIGAIKLARQNAELIQDIPSINNFNIALKKNQAEQWNFGRYRNQLRAQINQNPEWSSKQINTAKDLLIDQLSVTDDVLLRSFDEQNPNRAITKTSPDIVFDDIWGDLSIDDKTLIWSERMNGTPVSVLVGSEQVLEAKGQLRPSGSRKDVGFLGELKLSGGGVATEFSIGTTDVTGKEINIPTLVSTLTEKEIATMVTDIIPNKKPVPEKIVKKAVAHAKKRIKQGKSVFFERGEK